MSIHAYLGSVLDRTSVLGSEPHQKSIRGNLSYISIKDISLIRKIHCCDGERLIPGGNKTQLSDRGRRLFLARIQDPEQETNASKESKKVHKSTIWFTDIEVGSSWGQDRNLAHKRTC
jgi:hypothetical protein